MPIDYSQYPKDWKTRIRPEILERADDACEFCGVGNGEINPATGSIVVLTIAHLDHDIDNNDYSNLRALCQKCHNTHDAKHRAATRKSRKGKKQEDAGQMPLFPDWWEGML